MNAIRKDEELDFIHSAYVDQWDWEVVIDEEDRNLEFLKETVRKIYRSILATERALAKRYPALKATLPEDIAFITSAELEKEYPSLSRKEREDAAARKYGALFLIGIGGKLSDGLPTTPALPTTTTGTSMGTSSSTTRSMTWPLRFPRWASASTRKACSAN